MAAWTTGVAMARRAAAPATKRAVLLTLRLGREVEGMAVGREGRKGRRREL